MRGSSGYMRALRRQQLRLCIGRRAHPQARTAEQPASRQAAQLLRQRRVSALVRQTKCIGYPTYAEAIKARSRAASAPFPGGLRRRAPAAVSRFRPASSPRQSVQDPAYMRLCLASRCFEAKCTSVRWQRGTGRMEAALWPDALFAPSCARRTPSTPTSTWCLRCAARSPRAPSAPAWTRGLQPCTRLLPASRNSSRPPWRKRTSSSC